MLKVTIITVVYNAADTIEQAIQSVLSQSYKNIEYIIIDGGSTDGTLAVIEKYRDHLAYFVSEPDNGIYDAMNKGIRRATGDIIGLLNADDWYEPGAIEAVVKGFESSDADVVYGKIFLVERDGTRKPHKRLPLDKLFICMAIPHPATFVRRWVYERHGLFDTSFRIAADHELVLRLYVKGVQFYSIDDVLTNFRTDGISGTDYIQTATEDAKVFERYQTACPYRDSAALQMRQRIQNAQFRTICEERPHIISEALSAYGLKDGVVIWGTGVWGGRIHALFDSANIFPAFFVDSNPKKWDGTFCGLPVKNPEVLQTHSGNIFIAAKEYDADIARQLETMGNPSMRWTLLSNFIYEVVSMDNVMTKNRRGGGYESIV